MDFYNSSAAGRSFRFGNLPRILNYHYRLYERALTQIQKLKQRRVFLQECLKEQVLPPSIKTHLLCDSSPFHPVKRCLLQDRIEAIKFEIETKYLRSRKQLSHMKFFAARDVVMQLQDNAHQYARYQGGITKYHLKRKLDRLRTLTVWYKFTMPQNVVNLSSKQLNFFEKSVLGLGLGFNLPPSRRDIIPTAASFDKFLFNHKSKITNPSILRGAISPLLLAIERETPNLPKSLQNALSNLQRDKNTKVMTADKGNKVVLMDKADYDAKMEVLLSDGNTYEALEHDPLKEVNMFVRRKIDEIAQHCPDKDLITQFKRVNCGLAYIYGIPKLHKENCPMRPIISNIGTITRPLSGWLASLLSPYMGTISSAHVKNSIELKARLQDFATTHSTNIVRLGSLDVVSLFTRVPTDKVIEFVGRKIDEKSINVPIPKNCFLDLLRLCVENNYFQFNDKFYKQKFGISMGSPLSPVLANLYMEFFETEVLPTLPNQPVLWLRYVDDIIFPWSEDLSFDQFFNQINRLVPSIDFTCEWERNGSIPFLDTTVHRLSSGFSFAVYRKPTHSNQFIHFFSWHPEHVKRGVLYTLFLRAYRICDQVFLKQEIDFLYNSFLRVGYPMHFVDSVHKRVKRNFYNPRDRTDLEEETTPPTISLPFHEYVNKSVKPIFQANGCRVVNYASNTLRTNLIRNRPPRTSGRDDAPCVYEIPCQTCPKSYFGETGRGLPTRLREHKGYVRNNNKTKAVYKHSKNSNPNHILDFDAARILYQSGQWYNRRVVESTFILTRDNYNGTDQSTLAIDKLSSQIIIKNHPKIFNIE